MSLLESAAEHVAEYHASIVATSVVHDPSGGDWANERPFYEGEKVSHAVQMWWFTLQGLRNDLWSAAPPKMARKVLGAVFDQSLGLLVTRSGSKMLAKSIVYPSNGTIILLNLEVKS